VPQPDSDAGAAYDTAGGGDGGPAYLTSGPIHADAVLSLSTVGDNPQQVLTASDDNSVLLLDWQTGEKVFQWDVHERGVKKVVWGGASKRIFTASRDATICVLEPQQHEPLLRIDAHKLVISALTTDPANRFLCSGSRDCSLSLWDVATGQQTASKNIRRNVVTGAVWIPGEDAIFQTSEDLQIRVWDARSWEIATSVKTDHHFPYSCDVSPDGKYLLIGNNGFSSSGQLDGCECQVWDRRMEKLLCEYKGHEQSVNSCCFLPPQAGRHSQLLVASGSKDTTVQIWDAGSAEHLATCSMPDNKVVTALAAASDSCQGASFFCGNLNGSFQSWALADQGAVCECVGQTPPNGDGGE